MRFYKLLIGIFLLLGLGGMAGCQETSPNISMAVADYWVGDFKGGETALAPEIVKKNEDFVLNNCRYGSCAIAAGDTQNAEQAFLAAYEVINGVNTNDGGELAATLVFEGVKVWKGEPFERAMAHYYLGLIYLQKNDYGNARAAFQNSLFKLREYATDDKGVPEQDKYTPYESNFALGYFGLGICYLRTGEPQLADANFKRATKLNPNLTDAVKAMHDPKTNTLLFIDYGHGPMKAANGMYNENSAFYPTPAEVGPVPRVQAYADGVSIFGDSGPMPWAMTDTLAMAQDQKWQDIDTIRKTKAVLGTGLMAGGLGTAAYGANRGNGEVALIGAGVAGLGALMAASSQADVRYWEMLPRTVYVVPAALTAGTHQVQVTVGAANAVVQLTIPAAGIGAGNGSTSGDSGGLTVQYFRLR